MANPEQLFVDQVLIKKVKLKCCGIKEMLPGLGDARRISSLPLPVSLAWLGFGLMVLDACRYYS